MGVESDTCENVMSECEFVCMCLVFDICTCVLNYSWADRISGSEKFTARAYSFQSQLGGKHQGSESREAYWLIWSESKLEAVQNS